MANNNTINKKTSALSVNSEYSLPTVDGDADEVMTTDGSGTVTWEDLPSGGCLIQQTYNSTSSYVQINAATPNDNTIPQKTEGKEVITVSITPKSSTNILLIEASSWFSGSMSSNDEVNASFFQDDTSDAISAIRFSYGTGVDRCFVLRHRMVAGTTSSTTFKLRVGTATAQSATAVNGKSTPSSMFGGASSCIITVQEYKA